MSDNAIFKKNTIFDRYVCISVQKKEFIFEIQKLTGVSGYFQKMVSSTKVEKQTVNIELEEINLDVFKFFRDWIYGIRTSFRGIERGLLLDVFVFAFRFEITRLRAECYKNIIFWTRNDDLNFALRVLEIAVPIGDRKLKNIFVDWLNYKLEIPNKWNLRKVYRSVHCTKQLMVMYEKKKQQMSPLAKKEFELLYENQKRNLDTAYLTLIQRLSELTMRLIPELDKKLFAANFWVNKEPYVQQMLVEMEKLTDEVDRIKGKLIKS